MVRKSAKMSQRQRLDAIREEMLKADEISIEQLAAGCHVSGMTIRRDLENLEAAGDIIRTYGGAALARRLTFEFSFRDKQNKSFEQKHLIAEHAVRHVRDGQVVMLDTGTTTLQIAEQLIGKRSVTIITTSLAIVSKVQFAQGIQVVLLGGFLRRGSPDMHGPLTEQNVELFKTSVAFMGADAIDDAGNTYTHDLQVVNLDRKMAANAEKVIVVVDSSKFGHTAMCKVFAPGDYDLIITDSRVNKTFVKQLTRRKIEIQIV